MARLILPTPLEVFAAFFFGMLAMAPFALKEPITTKAIAQKKQDSKFARIETEKHVDAEVARLKSDQANNKT